MHALAPEVQRPTQLPPRGEFVLDARVIHQLALHKTFSLLPDHTELVRSLLAASPFFLLPSELERLLLQVETRWQGLIAIQWQLEQEGLHNFGLSTRGNA